MSVDSRLAEDGFAIVPAVLTEIDCISIEQQLSTLDIEGAGSRNLLTSAWCARLANQLRCSSELQTALAGSVAVQCTYFDKSPSQNWLVPIHQDLTIPVASRVVHPQLKGWSNKEGGLFVQPPPDVLDGLVAVRVHLDDNGRDNGPLRVVPGSHRAGRLPGSGHAALRQNAGEVECIVGRGGVVAMKPLLLHASSKSASSKPRRVLHYVYGPELLPHGLSWARVA